MWLMWLSKYLRKSLMVNVTINTSDKSCVLQYNKYIMDILFQLSRSKEHNKCKIHLMGDFNLDLLKFELHKPTEEFIDAMFSYGLVPTITKPTRTQGKAATLIDNIFTSSVSVNLSGILLNDISDHHMVFAMRRFPQALLKATLKNQVCQPKILMPSVIH